MPNHDQFDRDTLVRLLQRCDAAWLDDGGGFDVARTRR